ncbi:MAG TPA: MarR family winged helix-turn-helix transcriptional regulator [Anaerolineales bacterium]|nr:MarR family winged helix-turn-helix transcriptional regulator [Anaerolineales bacterium]
MSSTKAVAEVIREWSEVFMRRSGRDFRGFMEETGLSFSQINILMRLHHGGKCGVTEIGERLGITNAAASQSIDRLVVQGLIERTEDPEDRRAKQLALTQKGRTLVEQGIGVRSEWIEGVTESLTSSQREMIISALTLLTESARKTED